MFKELRYLDYYSFTLSKEEVQMHIKTSLYYNEHYTYFIIMNDQHWEVYRLVE